ncbi:MAG TPA: hypothetical protein VMQ83_12110 [Gammaproteobacteria bacterium]|nr:hypothetical protein [Gammaproteobacteria bacterium]
MWRLAAPVIALLLTAASFLRAGETLLIIACGLLLMLLAISRPWAARAVQLALVLAAARWLWLTWALASARAAAGVPFMRMVAILGTVALLTLLATLVFRSRVLRRYYRFERPESP